MTLVDFENMEDEERWACGLVFSREHIPGDDSNKSTVILEKRAFRLNPLLAIRRTQLRNKNGSI